MRTATHATTLPETRRLLSETFTLPVNGGIKGAFFDADSTLRVSLSGSVSANGPRDVLLLPGVAAKMKALTDDGYLNVIFSNQEGIAYGHVTLSDADQALLYTRELIRAGGGEIHYHDFAEGKGPDRKPGTGMFLRLDELLQNRFGRRLDLSQSFMVGDSSWKKNEPRPDGRKIVRFSNSDRLFAEALGIPFHEPADFFGWRVKGIDAFDKSSEVYAYWEQHRD